MRFARAFVGRGCERPTIQLAVPPVVPLTKAVTSQPPALRLAEMRTTRKPHAAAFALLAAVRAGHLPVEVTPEMVSVAAMTELGDS